MSLLNWFSSRKKLSNDLHAASSDLAHLESTKPYQAGRSDHSGKRKKERMERRELLYAVVRETMVRAGVLSSSYKFKVLSLDPRGRKFLVMVDLGGPASTTRLAEIEALVTQSARTRYGILVTGVYWRADERAGVADAARPAGKAAGSSSRPAPLQAEAVRSRPAPLQPEPVRSRPMELGAAPARFEPLQEDEIAAFRQALDAGVRGEQALANASQGKPGPASYTLLTGFEDTEMADGNANDHLSGTQWGALR